MTHRLREVDQHASLMLDQREAAISRSAEPLPMADFPDEPKARVPVPRRARAYLFHGPGGAAFAEITLLTSPLRHATGA